MRSSHFSMGAFVLSTLLFYSCKKDSSSPNEGASIQTNEKKFFLNPKTIEEMKSNVCYLDALPNDSLRMEAIAQMRAARKAFALTQKTSSKDHQRPTQNLSTASIDTDADAEVMGDQLFDFNDWCDYGEFENCAPSELGFISWVEYPNYLGRTFKWAVVQNSFPPWTVYSMERIAIHKGSAYGDEIERAEHLRSYITGITSVLGIWTVSWDEIDNNQIVGPYSVCFFCTGQINKYKSGTLIKTKSGSNYICLSIGQVKNMYY